MLVDYRCPQCNSALDRHGEEVVIMRTAPTEPVYCHRCEEQFVWTQPTAESVRNGTLVQYYLRRKS